MPDLNAMTRREFEQIPLRDKWDEEIRCTAIVILPARVSKIQIKKHNITRWLLNIFASLWNKIDRIPTIHIDNYYPEGVHDSGYRCMDFVACDGDKPICRLSGYSDVIHLDGIGRYGMNWLDEYGTVPRLIPPSGWSMDCLIESGLMRLWPSSGKMICGAGMSSFEVYAVRKGAGTKER